MSRRDRERRGYQLVVAGGVSGGVAVVGALLAIFGVIGWGLPFVAAIVMVICIVLFRRLARPSR
jgi:hypothetical protein